MAASRLRLAGFKLGPKFNISRTHSQTQRFLCTTKSTDGDESTAAPGRFAQFVQKEIELKEKAEAPPEPKAPETFASLLRNSKFIDLGDPEGKMVIGTIYHVVNDDLYIDFGWKFPAICRRPNANTELYIRGARVRLLIKSLELSTRFLGATSDITLLEADCVLHGLAK